MDFNEVTTVADLVKVNESVKSPLEAAKDMMCSDGVTWDDNRELISWLLTNSLQFHQDVTVTLKSSGNPESVEKSLYWAADIGKLAAMIAILEDIG